MQNRCLESKRNKKNNEFMNNKFMKSTFHIFKKDEWECIMIRHNKNFAGVNKLINI